MATTRDVAWMAAAAYDLERPDQQRIQVPGPWARIAPVDLSFDVAGARSRSGFGAQAYVKLEGGVATEVVIAFEGTNMQRGFTSAAALRDWFSANVPLYLGTSGAQIYDAVSYYEAVLQRVGAAYGSVPPVSFTGHSLGGGLASIMSVWFDRPAQVFAMAPFEARARSPEVMSAVWSSSPLLRAQHATADAFVASVLGSFDGRELNVRNTFVSGEALELLRMAGASVDPIEDGTGSSCITSNPREMRPAPLPGMGLRGPMAPEHTIGESVR